MPLERSAFHLAEFAADATPTAQQTVTKQIKQALRQAGLTMAWVSAVTSVRYGRKTPYFIPSTFLYKQKKGITPHICQIVALSQVTGYRFTECMKACGFDLRLIFALQLKLHTQRTVLVTPDPSVAACEFLVATNSEVQRPNGRYLFAKIGSRDDVVYPSLLPGSIVRADPYYSPQVLDRRSGANLLWLVEHAGGLTCCHVERVDREHIILLPSCPPLSAWPLRLCREARILGLVDLELRPRRAAQVEPLSYPLKADPPRLFPASSQRSFSQVLRVSRSRTGLTLRAAHEMTVLIARLLGNSDYGIALGQLSDYEATNKLPRHVAKIMSLCIIYGIDPWELLEVSGIDIDDSDKEPLFLRASARDWRESASLTRSLSN